MSLDFLQAFRALFSDTTAGRVGFAATLLLVLAAGFAAYEAITGHGSYLRISRQVELVERLGKLKKSDFSKQPELQQVYANLDVQLVEASRPRNGSRYWLTSNKK